MQVVLRVVVPASHPLPRVLRLQLVERFAARAEGRVATTTKVMEIVVPMVKTNRGALFRVLLLQRIQLFGASHNCMPAPREVM